MWLLRTKDATLKYFASPENVPRHQGPGRTSGYAILSHVWRENEQEFLDIQALPSKCTPGQTPRDIASEKIRMACKLAEEWDYEWIWIDTCCIDKSSSAELSEAINSMFHYYSLAGQCFAYLDDVCREGSYGLPGDEFKKSRWHTRGWTLQELIAPKQVCFVSKAWEVMGHKDVDYMQDTKLVEEATGVPVDVLKDSNRMKDFSVAQRMSWAAGRVTTRKEDEAYCLLGIFDINMPTLYGEGRKAFRRLQEEIMRQSPDTTLFAWGLHCTWDELVLLRPEDPASSEDPDYHLFATSPSAFRNCSQVRFVNPTRCLNPSSDTSQHDGYITFTSTPHGLSTVIPTFIHEQQLLGHLGWAEDRRYLLLLLQPLPSENRLSKGKLFKVGLPLVGAGTFRFPHGVYAPTSLNEDMLQQLAVLTWRKVYLAYDVVNAEDTESGFQLASPGILADSECSSLGQLCSPFLFDLRRYLPQDRTQRNLTAGDSSQWHPTHLFTLDSHSSKLPDVAWTGDPPALLAFRKRDRFARAIWMLLRLGVCTRCLSGASPQQVIHWAHVDFYSRSMNDKAGRPLDIKFDSKEVEHDCSNDHISHWSGLSRTFSPELAFQVTLSFTPFHLYKQKTLVLRQLDASYNVSGASADDCKIVYSPSPPSSSRSSTPLSTSVYSPSPSPPSSSSDGSRSSTPLSTSPPITITIESVPPVVEDNDDGEIEEDPMFPSSNFAVPAQPWSAAADEPVIPSSGKAPPPITITIDSAPPVIEDYGDGDGEIEEDPMFLSSNAVPAQPSAAIDEPVVPSSEEVPQTASSAQRSGRAESMQLGTKTPRHSEPSRRAHWREPKEEIVSGSSLRLPWRHAQKAPSSCTSGTQGMGEIERDWRQRDRRT